MSRVGVWVPIVDVSHTFLKLGSKYLDLSNNIFPNPKVEEKFFILLDSYNRPSFVRGGEMVRSDRPSDHGRDHECGPYDPGRQDLSEDWVTHHEVPAVGCVSVRGVGGATEGSFSSCSSESRNGRRPTVTTTGSSRTTDCSRRRP